MFKPETMDGMGAGAAAPALDNGGAGSLLSELSGVYQEVAEPELVSEQANDSDGPLNELSGTIEPPVETEQASEAVAGKEPEMISPPRIEPPAFFWKPQRRGFLRRR